MHRLSFAFFMFFTFRRHCRCNGNKYQSAVQCSAETAHAAREWLSLKRRCQYLQFFQPVCNHRRTESRNAHGKDFLNHGCRFFIHNIVSLANHSLNRFLKGASSFPSVYIESKLSLIAIYLTLFFGKYISVYEPTSIFFLLGIFFLHGCNHICTNSFRMVM